MIIYRKKKLNKYKTHYRNDDIFFNEEWEINKTFPFIHKIYVIYQMNNGKWIIRKDL